MDFNFSNFWEFLNQYTDWLIWLGALSLVTLLLSLLFLPWLLARIPPDYFIDAKHPPVKQQNHSILIASIIFILRNVIGAILIVAGILMLVLPGQGLLTLFAGVMICDFPGKYRFEYYLIRLPKMLVAINWFRAKAGAMPLVV